MSEPAPVPRFENALAVGCLVLVTAFHAWGATVGWKNLNLPGCEFRQAQTAISAFFIHREGNYSLEYPTPVLGKPWSIPMEFPLYQWTVAKVTDVTGWPLTQVGRGVSLACFYLGLPALYLLFRRLGLSFARALVVLCCVLCCPLYIFYARAFLIETMAWMFGLWFLLGYVLAVERRSVPWLIVATVGGAGAGLVKVTTLMAFLLPAFSWTLWWFWRDWRAQAGPARWRALGGRVAWCAAAVAIPFAAACWWVRYSDMIKAKAPAGAFLQSERMATYNFGIGARFEPTLWAQHWNVIFHEIVTVPVLVVAALAAVCFARARGWLIGLLVFYFFAVQAAFPILYAWHEYYYVAIAMLPAAAIGLALVGLLESRLPRWVAWVVIVAVILGQGHGYYTRYHTSQVTGSPGGSELTMALKKVTEPDDVIIIAGADWNSMIPYYAQRRALMIRRDLERTWQVIDPAFAALQGEPVTALILFGAQRENRDLLDRAIKQFDIDPQPVYQWHDAEVYLRRGERTLDLALLATQGGITLLRDSKEAAETYQNREVDVTGWAPRHRVRFSSFTPAPWKFLSAYGLNPASYHDREYLWVHPVTRLWFKLPAGRHRLVATMEYIADAYDEKLNWGDRSDGVELLATSDVPGGAPRVLGQRFLDPRTNPKDRGLVEVAFEFALDAPADVQFAVLPGPTLARDWILLEKLRIDPVR